ncbi:MAG: hypothetical protein LBH75_06690 [Treponema sp.]|nr:hypothetical protein [Treponema sp.]
MKKPGHAVIPILVSAAASAVLMQIGGILALTCLVPIGVLAFSRGVKPVWFSTLAAAVIHCLVLLGIASFMRQRDFSYLVTPAAFLWNCTSMTITLCVFAWIVAPPRAVPSTAFRFIIGGAVVCGVFAVGLRMVSDTGGLYTIMTEQIKALDMELGLGDQWDITSITRDVFAMIARGGGLAMAVLFLFANRQIGIVISAIAGKKKMSSGVVHFFAPPVIVWVLSFSLLSVIVFAKFIPVQPLEIIAWNAATMCVLLYIAQGLGIVMYFLSIPERSRWSRMAMTFLIVFLIMSPGINIIVFGVILLLGIAENWVTFRKFDKTSSTPVM